MPQRWYEIMCQEAWDSLLMKIRKWNEFMGGIFIISSQDILQFLPIQGRPPMISLHMITSFRFEWLCHYVRAAQDVSYRKIQAITRLFPNEFTGSIENKFCTWLITLSNLLNHLMTKRIPKGTIFVFDIKNLSKNKHKHYEQIKIKIRWFN